MSRPSARYVLPEFTERTNFGERRLDPYSKLFENRVVFLGTPLDEAAASDVITQFMHLEHLAPDRDITLYLNCPGGSFHAMTAIYDTMRYVTCEVQTYCLGQAASVGAVLLAAGTPGKRFTLPGARRGHLSRAARGPGAGAQGGRAARRAGADARPGRAGGTRGHVGTGAAGARR